MNWQYALELYLAAGVLMFLYLGFVVEGTDLPRGWWRNPSFLLAGILVVCAWWIVAGAVIVKQRSR